MNEIPASTLHVWKKSLGFWNLEKKLFDNLFVTYLIYTHTIHQVKSLVSSIFYARIQVEFRWNRAGSIWAFFSSLYFFSFHRRIISFHPSQSIAIRFLFNEINSLLKWAKWFYYYYYHGPYIILLNKLSRF